MTKPKDIYYLELNDGKHDVPTWAHAFQAFLTWGLGEKRLISFRFKSFKVDKAFYQM